MAAAVMQQAHVSGDVVVGTRKAEERSYRKQITHWMSFCFWPPLQQLRLATARKRSPGWEQHLRAPNKAFHWNTC